MHPIFCSIQDAPCIQVYNIESAPLICLNIQGASSIEHTIYGHVLGHKGGGCTCTQCTLAGSAPGRSSRPAASVPGVLAIGAHLAFLQRDSGYTSFYRPSEHCRARDKIQCLSCLTGNIVDVLIPVELICDSNS